MSRKSRLGEPTIYPDAYAPTLLHTIDRAANRHKLGIGPDLPFQGEDVWNAYELTWLDDRGKPCVALAEIRVPADSVNIIESKSMKLYLNSFAMERCDDSVTVMNTIASDLGQAARAAVAVTLFDVHEAAGIGSLPGECIDHLDTPCDSYAVTPELLDCRTEKTVSEELHSHLLRSLCPVTDQPDIGSVLIRYKGPQIKRSSLLRYVVSFRAHSDFHENCVERMFVDIKARCRPEQLTVYARYARRGGVDINPIRSDFESAAENLRLSRQ